MLFIPMTITIFDWSIGNKFTNTTSKTQIIISLINPQRPIPKHVPSPKMYQPLQPPETPIQKLTRNAALIITITLLNHTMSITYSIMTFKQESGGFVSIIVASLVCYFLSLSHLTIYGISILGILYLKMLEPYYSRSQIHYIVALSGVVIFPMEKILRFVMGIFDSFPGRVHASMVFGTALIALFKFFPLTIQNLNAFFVAANSNALTNPWQIIALTFKNFNFLTLLLTCACIFILFLLRHKLTKFPFIAILVLIGILINYSHYFLDYEDLCQYQGVDCKFYIVKLANMIPPGIQKLVLLIPSAAVMTVVLIFEQYLYLQEFQRRGKRYFGEGDLGETQKQSRTLAIANLISGCLGGLPICINMFATYQNFSFNIKSGYKGTKLVGLMQIPISYAFYSILKPIYQMIPLFILFVIVATPAIYFLSNMLRIHYRHLPFIAVLAGLNVVTHPIIALIGAAFVSIYDIAGMLKTTPAEILLENVEEEGSRRSSKINNVAEKKDQEEQPEPSQFMKRVIHIETDHPEDPNLTSYIMYRFTGAISYLNYFQHIEQITKLLQKYCLKNLQPPSQPQQSQQPLPSAPLHCQTPLILSFRYSQFIDEQSLQELALFLERLQNQNNLRVILTGLHSRLLIEMEKFVFYEGMLRRDQRSMYRLDQM